MTFVRREAGTEKWELSFVLLLFVFVLFVFVLFVSWQANATRNNGRMEGKGKSLGCGNRTSSFVPLSFWTQNGQIISSS